MISSTVKREHLTSNVSSSGDVHHGSCVVDDVETEEMHRQTGIERPVHPLLPALNSQHHNSIPHL